MLEARIKQLEGIIATAKIVDPSKIDIGKVSVLTKVTISNLATQKVVTYQIVGQKEADLKAGKISVSSPIAKGLLGKKKGSKVDITIPAGLITVEVIEIIIK